MYENIDKVRKDVTEYCIKNRNFILGFDSLSDEDKEHIYSLAASIVFHRENVMRGGGFVQSICNNDFRSVVALADNTAIRGVKLFSNIFNFYQFNSK